MTDSRRTKVTQAALGPSSVLTRLDTSMCRIVVTNTVSKGASAELSGNDSIIIGADEDCGLRIEDPTVSGQHAKITRTDGGALLVDLGSTNGTFYQRSRVGEVVVPYGATISVGKATVKVVPHENAVMIPQSATARFGDLVGEDRRMREMFSLLGDVAPTDATVVIEGETGTGKELVAKALHDHSERAKKHFVVFDCSAVPHDLVESALFGHKKGAFTGATDTRQGAFRRANGGTIFLDEIGELPLDLQPKLLRAIESRTVQQVGGDDYERVDVRVIAATNRNLKQEVRDGRFREDLYYRLAVVRIVLPPLRDRTDDLAILVRHFVDTNRNGKDVEIDSRSWEKLAAYSWPGNVRELKNVVERGLSLFRGPGMLDFGEYLPGASEYSGLASEEVTTPLQSAPPAGGAAGLPAEVAAAVRDALGEESGYSFKEAKNLVVDAFERHYLKRLVDTHSGNISRAASAASMDRKHLRELMKKHGLWSES
jgi:transcriptional regulator with GAF, ATPase, and Fis domain